MGDLWYASVVRSAAVGVLLVGVLATLVATAPPTRHHTPSVTTQGPSGLVGPVSVQASSFGPRTPLPLTEAEARRLVARILEPTEAKVATTPPHPSRGAHPEGVWVATAAGLAVLAGAFLRRPVAVRWCMAASEGDKPDDDFDAMVARLKAKNQAKASAGVGFDKEVVEKKASKKQAAVEEAPEDFADEELFAELRPSPFEMVVPALGSLLVIGLIPLATGIVRQLWVRYKITSRRICITSGWGGKEYTEVSLRKIKEMKYVRRHLGVDGDLVMELVGGGAVDMQSVPDFVRIYNYIYDRLSPAARERSMKLSPTA